MTESFQCKTCYDLKSFSNQVWKKKLIHTLAIFTIKHIERSPDLTAASLIKLTQMIKEKDMLKHEGIEKKT